MDGIPQQTMTTIGIFVPETTGSYIPRVVANRLSGNANIEVENARLVVIPLPYAS